MAADSRGSGAESRTDPVLDEEPDEILERAAGVGIDRHDRSAVDILITAVIGGAEVSLGGLACVSLIGAVMAQKASFPLGLAAGALVFPLGLFFVILGRSELFTENFLIPVVSVVNRERSAGSLGKLWTLSLTGNLIGCAGFALLVNVVDAFEPFVHAGYAEYAGSKLEHLGAGVFASGVVAGVIMTVLTWLLIASPDPLLKVVAIWGAGFAIIATGSSHVVVSSSILLAGFGDAGHDLVEVLIWLALATAGNVVGGVGLVTGFRLVQAREKRLKNSG